MINPCNLCSAKCCKEHLITVTSFDVLRAANRTGKTFGEFAELAPLKLLNYDNDTVLECYEEKDGKKLRYDYILAFKSHPCHFLGKDNLCTIHEFAPLGCKIYPFRSDEKLAPRALCPAIAKLMFALKRPDVKAEEYLKYLNAYKELVTKWNKKHGKKEDCMLFMLDESRKTRL